MVLNYILVGWSCRMDLGKYHGYSLTRQVQIACSAGRVLPHNALAVLASTAIRHFYIQETHKRNVLWDMRKWLTLCYKTGCPFYITCSVTDNNMASWREPRRFLILIVSLAVCPNIIDVKGEGKLACVVLNTDDKTLQVKLGCDSSEPRAVAWGKFRDEIHSTG